MEIMIMALETIVTSVLLLIAIVLTTDVIRRMKTLQDIDKLLDSAIDIHKEMMKTKSDMEEELYKFKLVKEAETNHKEDIDKYKRNVFGKWEEK